MADQTTAELIDELAAEVCCPNAHVARMSLCDCGGVAAEQLRALMEREAS